MSGVTSKPPPVYVILLIELIPIPRINETVINLLHDIHVANQKQPLTSRLIRNAGMIPYMGMVLQLAAKHVHCFNSDHFLQCSLVLHCDRLMWNFTLLRHAPYKCSTNCYQKNHLLVLEAGSLVELEAGSSLITSFFLLSIPSFNDSNLLLHKTKPTF